MDVKLASYTHTMLIYNFRIVLFSSAVGRRATVELEATNWKSASPFVF